MARHAGCGQPRDVHAKVGDVVPDVGAVRDPAPVHNVLLEGGVARIGQRRPKVALDRAQPAACGGWQRMRNDGAFQRAARRPMHGSMATEAQRHNVQRHRDAATRSAGCGVQGHGGARHRGTRARRHGDAWAQRLRDTGTPGHRDTEARGAEARLPDDDVVPRHGNLGGGARPLVRQGVDRHVRELVAEGVRDDVDGAEERAPRCAFLVDDGEPRRRRQTIHRRRSIRFRSPICRYAPCGPSMWGVAVGGLTESRRLPPLAFYLTSFTCSAGVWQ